MSPAIKVPLYGIFTLLAILLMSCDPFGTSPWVDRLETLFFPYPDTSADGKWRSGDGDRRLFSRGIVREHEESVEYKIYIQPIGNWTQEREFQWNYFLIKSLYLFQDEIKNLEVSSLADLYGSLNDRFTEYIDSSKATAFLNTLTTTTRSGSMGVFIATVPTNDTIYIKEVITGSPAAKAGINKLDRVLRVNDSTVTGDSALVRFNRFSKGDSGTALKLNLKRGVDSLLVSLVKDVVEFPSILQDTVDKVTRLQILGFTPKTLNNKSTSIEFREALLNIPPSVVLLDLRGNPGGSVLEVEKMCDEILPIGPLFTEEFRFLDDFLLPRLQIQKPEAKRGGAGESFQFVLLSDGLSASAAEILLGCISEGRGSPIVGEKSFGKGIGQILLSTPMKGLSKITTARFLTPSGYDYHQRGIKPDYPTAPKDALAKAVEVAKNLAGVLDEKELNRISLDVAEWNSSQLGRPVLDPGAWRFLP